MFITAFLPSHTTSFFLIQFYSQGKYFHLSCRQKTLRLAWACGIKFYKYTPSSVWVMSVLKAKQAQALPFTFCAAIWLPTLVWLSNISCDLQISSERSEHIETGIQADKSSLKIKEELPIWQISVYTTHKNVPVFRVPNVSWKSNYQGIICTLDSAVWFFWRFLFKILM